MAKIKTQQPIITRPQWLVSFVLSVLICGGGLVWNVGLQNRLKGAIAYFTGNSNYYNNDFGNAGINYETVLRINPEQWTAQYNLANAYYRQGRYAEAIKLYNMLITQKEDNQKPAILNNLGNAYYMLCYYSKSLQAYQAALLLDDRDSVIRRNFLFVTIKSGKNAALKHANEKNKETKQKNNNDQNKQSAGDIKEGKRYNDGSNGKFELSDREMNNILNQANQPVPDAGDKRNSRKKAIKETPDALDY